MTRVEMVNIDFIFLGENVFKNHQKKKNITFKWGLKSAYVLRFLQKFANEVSRAFACDIILETYL